MAPPRDEVMRTDEARSFCRRQFIRLVAAGIGSILNFTADAADWTGP